MNVQVDEAYKLTNEEVEDKLDELVRANSVESDLSLGEKIAISTALYNDLRGLSEIQPLLNDNKITEIMVNGPNQVFVEIEGQLIQTDVVFESKEKLEDIIQKIVSRMNRMINERSPICDVRLEDGSRVNIVLPPIAIDGPIITIRKFSQDMMTMADLVQLGSISEEIGQFLERLVKARYNIFICGGTGSGKTTMLNILSNFIMKEERVITIEDSAELQLNHVTHKVRLEARNQNTEGVGEISIRDLIKASLRMRPDRIIVGEVRGHEAIDMLQAMNTGHDGSLSTGHANSIEDMLSRLETMVLLHEDMPIKAVRQQIGSAIDMFVYVSRAKDYSRKLMAITEVIGVSEGEIMLNPLYQYQLDTDTFEMVGQMKHTEKLARWAKEA